MVNKVFSRPKILAGKSLKSSRDHGSIYSRYAVNMVFGLKHYVSLIQLDYRISRKVTRV